MILDPAAGIDEYLSACVFKCIIIWVCVYLRLVSVTSIVNHTVEILITFVRNRNKHNKIQKIL